MKFLTVFSLFVFAQFAHAQKTTEKDSIKAIVDAVFPGGIKGTFRPGCTTDYHGNRQDLYYRQGNIAFLDTDDNDVIEVKTDTLTIRWRDPKYKGGRYFLAFTNLFDETFDYKISDTNSSFIDLSKIEESTFLITVYSEDGRASSKISIRRKK